MSSGALLGDRVREGDDLTGVAQVDADDSQPMQPVAAVGHAGEPPGRVPWEARRDRRVRAVAQQAERDVHPDLRPPSGQQGPAARQVGAGVPLGVVERRAVGTELVVEGVDLRVAPLADVTGAWLEQRACGPAGGPRRQRQTAGLVVDPPRRGGRGRLGHITVGAGDRLAALGSAALAHRLVEARGRPLDRDRVGMVDRQPVDVGDHAQEDLEVDGIDPVGHFRNPRSRWSAHQTRKASSVIPRSVPVSSS